jgi:hypothetical protein
MSRTRIDPSLLNNLSSNLNMGSNKIVSLANGSASTDATAFGQVQYAFQNAVQATTETVFSTTSTSPVNTNLSASITPTSSSSRIKITISGPVSTDNGVAGAQVFVHLARGGSSITGGSGLQIFQPNSANALSPCSITYIDSPATTSSTTYSVQIASSSSSATARFGFTFVTQVITLEELR